jgi:hypothetical protein
MHLPGRLDLGRAVARAERAGLLGGKRVLRAVRALAPAATPTTVFVAGVQRSGTNMVMDVLERSLGTDVYHERDARAFDNYLMRPPELILQLRQRVRASHFVIKALCELQRLSQLMQTFAPARTLWVLRDCPDVVNSMLVSFRNQARQVLRIAADRNSDGWRGEGMSDETHALVRQLAHPAIDDASAAALQWYFRNVLYFEQGFDRDPRVLLVRYERLVTHPHEEFERMFRFLGLHYSAWVSKRVFASSVRKRAAPPIHPDIQQACERLAARFEALVPA